MRTAKNGLVISDALRLESGSIPLDSDSWQDWLAQNHKFHYESSSGHFMAQCEFRRGKPYWYAYRRQNGKLAKAYLGKSDELSAARLQQVCLTLAGQNAPAAHPAVTPAFPSDFIDASVLSSAKTNGPLPPPRLVVRPRLTNRIQTPITLIYAPSGFGKSTLLNDWKQSCSFPVVWLSLDEQDNHPQRFWNSVILSFQALFPGLGADARLYLNSSETAHQNAAALQLLNQVTQKAATLPAMGWVIDDVHHLRDSEILDTLQFWVDHLPPNLRLVFSGHSKPPLAFAHLRSQGLLTELDANDLRFTQDEAACYLAQYAADDPLAPDDLARLAKHTEGWAAGLTLSALAMSQQKDRRKFIDTFSGAHIYVREYFLETVLQRTSPQVQFFLFRTAILKHLTGSLCDALTGWKNGDQILAELWENNLFIEKLEQQGWYRYHDLFAEMLSSQLQARYPTEVAQLHHKAAEWYRDHFSLPDAVNHLLTVEAWEEASTLIEEMALRELELNGEDSRLLGWLQNLPETVVQKHTTLLAVYLSLAAAAVPKEKSERFIANIETNLTSRPEALLSEAEREVLEEIRRLRQGGDQLSGSLGDEKWMLIRDFQKVHFNFAQNSIEMHQALPVLLARARREHNLFIILMAGGALSRIAFVDHQLRGAEKTARQVLDEAMTLRGRLPEPASICLATLSLVHMARGEIELAQKYLAQAHEVDPNPTSTNMPILLSIIRAKTLVLQKRFDEALASLHAAQELQRRRPSNNWNSLDLSAYEARTAARMGDLDGAQRILDESPAALTHPLSQLAQAEVHYAHGQADLSEDLLTRLLAENPRGLHYEPLLDARILLSLAQFRLHKIHQSCQIMLEAVRLAAPEGFILPFLEHGTDPAPQLALLLETEVLSREARQFIQELLRGLPHAGGIIEINGLDLMTLSAAASISPREQEVLRLSSAGLSLREMALRLCISESTVKTHLSNIYAKLEVRSRTKAIHRARELELI